MKTIYDTNFIQIPVSREDGRVVVIGSGSDQAQKKKKKKEEEEMKYIIEIKIQGQYASLYALKCFWMVVKSFSCTKHTRVEQIMLKDCKTQTYLVTHRTGHLNYEVNVKVYQMLQLDSALVATHAIVIHSD